MSGVAEKVCMWGQVNWLWESLFEMKFRYNLLFRLKAASDLQGVLGWLIGEVYRGNRIGGQQQRG